MEKRRVVITGLGAITPCGVNVKDFWQAMKDGKSGITKYERISNDRQTVLIAGEIKEKDFDPTKYFDPKEAKRVERYIQFGVAASDEAIQDAGLENAGYDPYRIGVIMSSAAGGFDTFEKNHLTMLQRGYTKGSPFTIPYLIVNMAAGRVSIKHGFKG